MICLARAMRGPLPPRASPLTGFMPDLILPARNWTPRHYQTPLWRYLEGGGKRAVSVWHRRSGKDEVGLHWLAVAAHQRPATYWYLLPQASQARKAVWAAINPHTGIKRIDEAFPDVDAGLLPLDDIDFGED